MATFKSQIKSINISFRDEYTLDYEYTMQVILLYRINPNRDLGLGVVFKLKLFRRLMSNLLINLNYIL